MQSTSYDQPTYFSEVSIGLVAQGFEPLQVVDSQMPVHWKGTMLCTVRPHGGITYRNEFIATPEREEAKKQVYKISRTVHEYMKQLAQAAPLKAGSLKDGYRILADYNGTVFAAKESTYGVQFVTWDWDFDRTGLSHGHFFNNNYDNAKKDFAVRSGMISQHQLFTEEQLVEVYRCVHDTLDLQYQYPITGEREEALKEIARQIEYGVPNLDDLIQQSNASEMDVAERGDFLRMSQNL